ncbi:MAG: hypothetical protein ABT11_16775 [Novosphingobium sp. SCN 66-18]|nr:MAG: hypothetical protein ABT11_16775 [Novosphingobium sp. SCN 66-18]
MDDDFDRAGKARKVSPFLPVKQAAHYLGLAAKTLANLRSRGEGPPFRRHGGQVRYHINDLEEWSRTNGRKPRKNGGGDA